MDIWCCQLSMMIKRWDIYWAYVKYEESDEVKRRPVLIINSTVAAIISFKMTSKDRGDEPPEYEVREWKEAGLPVQTYVRCDKPIRLSERDLDGKIGQLTERDRLLLGLRLQGN